STCSSQPIKVDPGPFCTWSVYLRYVLDHIFPTAQSTHLTATVDGQESLSLFPMLPSQKALSFVGYRLGLEEAICGPLTMYILAQSVCIFALGEDNAHAVDASVTRVSAGKHVSFLLRHFLHFCQRGFLVQVSPLTTASPHCMGQRSALAVEF
ncbi:Uncharacterized protein DAT39_002422, partial [Clarias magur]